MLASLPRDVWPKWQLGVARPSLVATLGGGAIMLGSEVVKFVVGRD